ncbi:AAA family ATPase [Bacillus velezensis]|uniref:AAA family ATPase n=1 Tax=Bacillus TaxID=1386 RepID=UPI000BA60FEF|nr:AAA family ATPase [Bacillus velezensis]PAE34615.1 hypothetical protein CHI00_05645 [Bacillus velezensis]UMU16795.1 ATP-binding protein [Bacillus velezensis]URJ74277.1 AAA family ATPase [Bacillus velezensis]URJ78183.1 AAA family ATPase [Bacillus velezensis]
MIRSAKVPDIWRKIDRNNYRYYIESINLNGILGIVEPISFRKGIFSICGLNGVGKSTVFTAIKDILGLSISDRDRVKIKDIEVTGKLKDGNKDIILKNIEGKRLIDVVEGELTLEDINFQKLIQIYDYIDQPNFNELVEQHDDNIFNNDDIQSLNYLIGKTYDSVVLREIEVEDEKIIPYFQVKCNGLEYDSLKMGTGEHFLFYIYWLFKRIVTYGILLIEEPEVFISVKSQVKLMNFIAKKINDHKFSVILVTHSPFILKNLSTERMLVLNNYLDVIDINNPKSKEETLENLGLYTNKKGIFIFEDTLAIEFFKSMCKKHANYLLKYFDLEKVNGFSEITKILSIPQLDNMKYNIVGFYDGDLKNSGKISSESLNMPHKFLPGEKGLEEEFMELTRSRFVELSTKLGITQKEFRMILGNLQGSESHDWLMEISNETHIDFNLVVDIFYNLWELEHEKEVKDFLSDIEKLSTD